MNLKVLAAAVSVLAICAEARIIGSDDGDLPQVDEFDKDLGLELQALSARLGDKLPAQQSLALNPLQLLLDVLDRVDTALLAATSALNDTVTTATQAAEYATQGAVDRWNQALQDAINRTDAVAVQQCVAEHSSLPTLAGALERDAVRCVTDETSGISAELQKLRERTQSFIDQLRKRPLQILDLSLILNPYTRSLVVDATVLALQLVVDNLQSSAACVGNVINARSAEANASINAVRQCIDASLNSTTAAPTA